MLQRIACRTLKPGDVLGARSLGNVMFPKEAVVGNAAAYIIAAPGSFSLHPRFGFRAEDKTAVLPLRTGTRPHRGRVVRVLGRQAVDIESLRKISVEEIHRAAFSGVQCQIPLQKQCALRTTRTQIIVQATCHPRGKLNGAFEKFGTIGCKPIGRGVQRDKKG